MNKKGAMYVPQNRKQQARLETKADDLRLVIVYLEGTDNSQKYIISAQDLDKFVEATKRLHFKPGVNPHNNQKTTPLKKITSQSLYLTGPYWWTTPNLKENDDPKGAIIWHWDPTDITVVWEAKS